MIPITVSYPAVSAEWHPTKNGDLRPDMVSAGMTKKVWWLCPKTCVEGCPHEWEAYLGNRCKLAYGCPYCSVLTKRVCIHTSIAGTHPEIAAQWHPTKNGAMRPDSFSYGSEKKVWWLCPMTCSEGCPHEWEADISKRILRGIDAGCPFCASNHKQTCIHTSIVYTHPDLVEQWHPTKNGSLTPMQITHGSCVKVWWLCENTCDYGCVHEWIARPADRVRGKSECPTCCKFLHKICIHQSILYTMSEISEEWHPTKNGALKPSQFSYGSEKRVWWRCNKEHSHEWQTAINNRCGSGKSECPYCTNKTEEKLFNYLQKKYTTKRQFTIETCRRQRLLPFDICLPTKRIIIELDGPHHFRKVSNWFDPEKMLRRDIYKMQKAEQSGYKVIRIAQADVYSGGDDWLDAHLRNEIESDDRDHTFIAENTDLYVRHIELYLTREVISLEDE